jgi:hypothetical protein
VRLAESIGLSAQKTKQEVYPQSRASHPFFARENRSVQTVLKRLFGIGLIRKNEKTAAILFFMSDSAGSWLITIAEPRARWLGPGTAEVRRAGRSNRIPFGSEK